MFHYYTRRAPISLLDEVFSDFFDPPLLNGKNSTHGAEVDGNYVYVIDIPGVKKDNVDITVDNRVLKIEAQRNGEETKKTRAIFKVPEIYDISKVDAELTDGVLTLTIPKNENVESQIKVKIR